MDAKQPSLPLRILLVIAPIAAGAVLFDAVAPAWLVQHGGYVSIVLLVASLKPAWLVKAIAGKPDPLPARLVVAATKAGVPLGELLYYAKGKGDALAVGLSIYGSGATYISGAVLDASSDDGLCFLLRHEHEHNRSNHTIWLALVALLGSPFLVIPSRWICELLADRAAAKQGFRAEDMSFRFDLFHPPAAWRRKAIADTRFIYPGTSPQ